MAAIIAHRRGPSGLAVTMGTPATLITPTATPGASVAMDPIGAVAVTTAAIIGVVGGVDGIADADGVAVAGIIENNRLIGAPFRVSNETFGVDPYRGRTKRLRVTIVGPNGLALERIWQEGDRARL